MKEKVVTALSASGFHRKENNTVLSERGPLFGRALRKEAPGTVARKRHLSRCCTGS